MEWPKVKKLWVVIYRRPVALISLIVLGLLYFSMIFAEFLAPYTPTDTFKNHGNHPPGLTLYSSKYGLGSQVQKRLIVDEITKQYARIKGSYYRICFFVHGPQYKWLGLIKSDLHLFGTNEPYEESGLIWKNGGRTYPVFLFGSDSMGRDLFTRILYGSRISLTIGFIGVFISLFLSILLGGISGYYGGFIDWLIMRFAEFFILIPGLYMILFLRSVLSRDLDSGQTFMLITAILSFVGWPGGARLVRGMVHSIKREDFILSAQLDSIPSLTIIIKQIIPQMASILIISITLGIPGFILGETALSYLGLGIVDPAVSWGSLISRETTTISNLMSFPWFLIPGAFLLLTTLSFNFLGDLLRDLLDPYHRDKGGA